MASRLDAGRDGLLGQHWFCARIPLYGERSLCGLKRDEVRFIIIAPWVFK